MTTHRVVTLADLRSAIREIVAIMTDLNPGHRKVRAREIRLEPPLVLSTEVNADKTYTTRVAKETKMPVVAMPPPEPLCSYCGHEKSEHTPECEAGSGCAGNCPCKAFRLAQKWGARP
jgi:hypothetical protein